MTRFLVLIGSGLAWAVMMAALIRTEVLPYFEYQAPPSYGDQLRNLKSPEITRGEILAAGVKVGEIETLAERLLEGGRSRLRTRAGLKARVLSTGDRATDEIPIQLLSETLVDSLYRLEHTRCAINLGFGLARIDGTRREDQLDVVFSVSAGDRVLSTTKQTVDFPKEGMIGDLFQPFPGGGALFVGKKWKIPTMTADLTGPRLGWLYAAVTERETITWQEGPVDTLRVEIRTEPTEEKRPTHISWCREDGTALRQQFTFQSLVYDIVFVSRTPMTRADAYAWGRQHFRRDE